MSHSDDQAVVIRLEIRIPVAGASVSIATTHAPAKPRQLEIILPGDPAHVRTGSGGNRICALGKKKKEGKILMAVLGKVYPSLVTTLAAKPPYDAVSGTFDPNTGDWQFIGPKELPGAVCGPGPYNLPVNTFAVWYAWNDGSFDRDSQVFHGLCSTGTDCDGGSRAGLPVHPAGEGVQTGVRHWRMKVEGFGANAAAFNGVWTLALCPARGEDYIWHNGGDGTDKPRVELRGEGPVVTVWRLTFRHRGCQVHYTKPAAEWHALNANVLSDVSSAGVGTGGTLPAAVTLEPA